MKPDSGPTEVLPVDRSKRDARDYYDRVSGFYGFMTGLFERRFSEMALSRLGVREGERVLEIGFGAGHCLTMIAEGAGERGRAAGIDISQGMVRVSRKRLDRAGLRARVDLCVGDAARLPYRDGVFDAVFMSHTLELFDTPDIPAVLAEVRRVLKPGGRLGIASMSREGGRSMMLRLYEWAHTRWPKYVDCRPIYAEKALRNAGFEIETKETPKLFGLPEEIVAASKPSAT